MTIKLKQQSEAVKRMEKYGLNHEIIDLYKNDNIVCISNDNFTGEVLQAGFMQSEIDKWENKTGNIVYHVILDSSAQMIIYLYVSEYEEEWEYDWEDINNQSACAYAVNIPHPECSEYGSVGLRNQRGTLERIW